MIRKTLKEIVDDLPIGKLVNTAESPFWYIKNGDDKFAFRYAHESALVGDVFYDGNNGDRWTVRAANTQFKRLIVENKTQGGLKLVYWI